MTVALAMQVPLVHRAIELFNSSMQKYNLHFKWYIGDGDSSSAMKLLMLSPMGILNY